MKYPEKSNLWEKWFVLVEPITRQAPEEAVRITPTVMRQKAMIAPAQFSFSTYAVSRIQVQRTVHSQWADLLTSTNPTKILPISKPVSQVMLNLT